MGPAEIREILLLNASPLPLTVDLDVKDTHEIIKYLLKRFNCPKLYLAGFSWGTVLGIKIAQQNPSLLYAYVAISQLVDQKRSEQILLQRLKTQAIGKKNQTALTELSFIKIPIENRDHLFYEIKWMLYFDNSKVSDTALRKSLNEFSNSMFLLFIQAAKIDFTKIVRSLQCPIYFFAGRNDFITNHDLTYSFYQQIKDKNKHFY